VYLKNGGGIAAPKKNRQPREMRQSGNKREVHRLSFWPEKERKGKLRPYEKGAPTKQLRRRSTQEVTDKRRKKAHAGR